MFSASELRKAGRATWHNRGYLRQVSNSASEIPAKHSNGGSASLVSDSKYTDLWLCFRWAGHIFERQVYNGLKNRPLQRNSATISAPSEIQSWPSSKAL